MAARTLTELLEAAFPGDEVSVEDRTGGGDHFQVTVVSERFDGLSLLDQHRLVCDALAASLVSDVLGSVPRAEAPSPFIDR